MSSFKLFLNCDFSSSFSSSSDDDDDDIENIAALVVDYKMNTATMMEILQAAEQPNKHGGSVPGREYMNRDRKQGHDRPVADYFAVTPVHFDSTFRRRFRMNRDLYLRILNAIVAHNPYFVQKEDACHIMGLSPLQKMTSAMRMLAYGVAADAMDDYVQIGESTATERFKQFCQSIIKIFRDEYLRSPTADDIARLFAIGNARGFPRMLESLDCMHWEWKNCPTAWQGQYVGHVKKPTIILEAVASYDLWIWHAFFGMPGSHNDLNVLDRSPLFSDLAQGKAPHTDYTINGHTYNMGYYLADGIYPPWATIVQTISSLQGAKRKHFSTMQESARKDVERAFGMLQSRFAIVCGPARFWDLETLGNIMKTCIILHNMIVEDERDSYLDFDYEASRTNPSILISRECTTDFESFVSRHVRIRDKDAYHALRNDLIEHLWQLHGDQLD